MQRFQCMDPVVGGLTRLDNGLNEHVHWAPRVDIEPKRPTGVASALSKTTATSCHFHQSSTRHNGIAVRSRSSTFATDQDRHLLELSATSHCVLCVLSLVSGSHAPSSNRLPSASTRSLLSSSHASATPSLLALLTVVQRVH